MEVAAVVEEEAAVEETAAAAVEEPVAVASAVEADAGEAAADGEPSPAEVDPAMQAGWDQAWTAILELLFAKVSARGGLFTCQHAASVSRQQGYAAGTHLCECACECSGVRPSSL